MDKEICGEPSSLFGATPYFVPWHISFLYAFPSHYVDWKAVGFHFVKENSCEKD
jgi:hypothetical protein